MLHRIINIFLFMFNSIKKPLKSYFSLKFVQFEFTDSVDGCAVNRFVDCYGNHFLKSSKWDFFKVQVKSI